MATGRKAISPPVSPLHMETTEKRTKYGEDENEENDGGEVDNIRVAGSCGCPLYQPIANWSPLDSGEMEGEENNKECRAM